jgi:signal transduction histidine kinase
MKFFIPLRFKILFSLLLGITIVVSVITFTMAKVFHTDKTTYIKEVISTNAIHTASETHSLVLNYIERSKTFARVAYDAQIQQDEKSRMLDDISRDFSEMVAITFFENGVEQASVIDEIALADVGLSRADLDIYRTQNPVPSAALGVGDVLVTNSTLRTELPVITIVTGMTIPERGSGLVVEALVRTDSLMAVVGRSELFESFILEPGGGLLAHKNPERVLAHGLTGWMPDGADLQERSSLAATFDYVIDGIDMIGGFAPVGIGQLMVGVQIPRSEAFLSARDLFNKLLGVSLIILLGGASISLLLSYRITRPLERLSRATEEVGRGDFEIQLTPTSSDEIGNLTLSVNQMAFELKERERTLEETQSALIQSEKMSAFGQLSAGIAHEVKNPLAGILGYAQLSLKKLKSSAPVYKNLVVIEKETRRCNAIIENLMKFARQDKPELRPLALNDVVEDAMTLVDHQMGINQIQLEKDLADDLQDVRGDANQLIQVFMNILINAQQAMDGNPGTITVTTGSPAAGTVEVRIRDTGPGMPAEKKEQIFEPFFTTKEAGKGTGLGLAVTYGIIKDHGGDIRVESEPGHGATFIITLSVAAAADQTAGESPEAAHEEQQTGEERGTPDLASERLSD